MAYEWDSSLETGYERVDNQHQQLIEAVNTLVDARATGKGDKVVTETLYFLVGYAIEHFSEEEELQLWFKYPDYLNHKQQHDEFKIKVSELVQRVEDEGPTVEIINLLSSTVVTWLIDHIRNEDFRMATFIKAAISDSGGNKAFN